MKPLNVISMLVWPEVETGGAVSADGVRFTSSKEPLNYARPTYGQAAELFNVGYQAIAQSPALLDYFKTSCCDKLQRQELQKPPSPQLKLSMALNSVASVLRHGYTSHQTGHVGFLLPVPQPADIEGDDVWLGIRKNDQYTLIQAGNTLSFNVSLAAATPEAKSMKQAQAFFTNANMLLENKKSCLPDQTFVEVQPANIANTVKLPLNDIVGTLRHVAKANYHLKNHL